MPTHSIVVFVCFSLLGLTLMINGIIFRRRGKTVIGKPTIDRLLFLAGKLTTFYTWIMFVMKAIFPTIGYITVPMWLSWVAVALLIIASLIMSFAFITLGKALIVGIPIGETELKTGFIYRISRNPIYLGVYLINIASSLYFPNLINITFALVGIYFHHRIVLAEEVFLRERFGAEWEQYSQRVRRYL
jgi:protein-S-isoprenylcysteine O-methyltransferase Ste14